MVCYLDCSVSTGALLHDVPCGSNVESVVALWCRMQTTMQQDVVIPGLNTVITEVALPASVRVRNIEETEAMKRRLLGG